MNVSDAAILWGELYSLLCKYPAVRNGLAQMPDKDKPKLDDQAEEILANALGKITSR